MGRACRRVSDSRRKVSTAAWSGSSSYARFPQHRLHELSVLFPTVFWEEQAAKVHWFQKYDSVLHVPPALDGGHESNKAFAKWFKNGKVNVCYQCLDHNIFHHGLGQSLALVYDSPQTSTKVKYTYQDLLSEVSLLAYSLKQKLHVGQGDRVLIYMPVMPHTVIAMLACARIGAIHSVVFGGFAAKQLALRIVHAKPKVLFAATCGICGDGTLINYKRNVDDALDDIRSAGDTLLLDNLKCVILQRPDKCQSADVKLNRAMDFDWEELRQETLREFHTKKEDDEKGGGGGGVDQLLPVFGTTLSPNMLPEHRVYCDVVPVDSDHPLYIAYTSGATGNPKGVVRGHVGQIISGNYAYEYVYHCGKGEVFFAAADIGWVLGHSCSVYGCLLSGCTSVLYEGKPINTPDAGSLWRICEEYGVKVFFTATTSIRAVRQDDFEGKFFAKYNLNALQSFFVAGERTDVITYKWLQDKLKKNREIFATDGRDDQPECTELVESGLTMMKKRKRKPIPIVDNWWQTETGWPMTSIMQIFKGNKCIDPIAGSCGHVIPGWDLKILDDDGTEVDEDVPGNVVVKLPLPPGSFTGLWQNDAKYVETYMARFPGYYDTGDYGYINESGYVYILSRTDDVINVAGYRLSTYALEESLMNDEEIVDAAVVPMKDKIRGHLPVGFVVLKHLDQDPTSTEWVESANLPKDTVHNVRQRLIDRVRSDIGAFASFKNCVIVQKLPKTRSGKTLRTTLSAMLDRREYTVPPTIEDESALSHIAQAIQEQACR